MDNGEVMDQLLTFEEVESETLILINKTIQSTFWKHKIFLSEVHWFVLEKSVVLDVVFYQSNQDLLQKILDVAPPLIICPSPQVADNLRSLAPSSNIITISKWTSDHLKSQGLKRARKSELMIKLAPVWRHYFPNEGTSKFLESFELFTELRSYTLNIDLLTEFLLELDEDIRKSIHIFWIYLDQQEIIDEHLSYLKVTESKQHISFWMVGFKHMSGVQIDMLKTISENHEVEVLFPESVYSESLPNDWIRWLSVDEMIRQKSPIEKKSANINIIPKGKGNIVLREFFKKNPNHDLVMAGTQIGLMALQEAQQKNSFFKTNEDLFSVDIELLISDVRDIVKEKKIIVAQELQAYLEEQKNSAVKKGEYRKFKVIELFEAALVIYAELQTSIDSFAIDIMEFIISLNSPRVSLLSLEAHTERLFIDMNGLNFRDESRGVGLFATASMGGFRANERILSEAMTKALRVIGPIKRAGLDFLFHKYELLAILSDDKNILLIEEQLLESDLSWREILKNFNLQDYDLNVEYKIKEVQEFLNNKKRPGPFVHTYFSASRLQSFIDCPQKYYFNYIDVIDNRPDERSSLGPDELGDLEHKIIDAYFEGLDFKKQTEVNFERHRKSCQQIFNDYLDKSRLDLNETEKARSYNEIMHYTLNGIAFLHEVLASKNAASIRFEIELQKNPWNLKGSIDCLIECSDKKIIVIDFKRSSGATGTKTETLEFKKIQLWVYLLTLRELGHEIESFGYLNLSDVSDDKLYFNAEESDKLLTESMGAAQLVIENAINSIKAEKIFPPRPREKKVCNYCPVNLFCLKGELA